ncbi:hypothetical protein F5144DRAFT_560078 [Chaetomium tenue]|uniref:Uncharacterized protein n=1 Tax=Chaetomium tenue TaxID=1854479 RepID=A0ACB7PFS1_9PEZI|nr:hypothetical protein F5144DRAFT_560078 [Chaetomium globosum]
MASPKFYPFMRLPLELRQQIWEMSADPREVDFSQLEDNTTNDSRRQPRPCAAAAPPPLLTACTESRAHMQRFYTQTSLLPSHAPQTPPSETSPPYCWVNLAADTVRLADRQLPTFSHLAALRKLVVETRGGHFERSSGLLLTRPGMALQELTILDLGPSPEESWWFPWIAYMELFYYGCDAVAFDTTVLHHDDGLEPLTRENWLRVDRAWRKKMLAQIFEGHPELIEEVEGGVEDEDDEDAENVEWLRMVTCWRRWRHVDECACANKKAGPVSNFHVSEGSHQDM